jgi:hypothetical protein
MLLNSVQVLCEKTQKRNIALLTVPTSAHAHPSSFIPPLPSQWEEEKLCVSVFSLVYNFIRPKTTTMPFVLTDVCSMVHSDPTMDLYHRWAPYSLKH